MIKQVLPIILGIHLLSALIYSLLILLKISRLRKEFIIPLLLVPVFGILAAIAIELINARKKQGLQTLDLHKFTLDNDIYWKTINNRKDDENIVPLEEAMIINDEKMRRKLMLDALFDDPKKYLDVLMIARNNEDIETAHYATTTIAKIQREFQLEIQKLTTALEEKPNDQDLLDRILIAHEKFIESGVLKDYLLRRQRMIYAQALDQKLATQKNDKATIIRKIHNSLHLKDFNAAYEASDLLKSNWPLEEESWIETLRVCVESKDKNRLKGTIEEIRNSKIPWTKYGREQVTPWLHGA
jgi:predicted outer membrane lipoprotein